MYSTINPNSVQDVKPLTGRETEILRYLAEGHSSKQIASVLFISKGTVDNHRKNLLKKMNAKSTGQIVQMYLRKIFEIKNIHL